MQQVHVSNSRSTATFNRKGAELSSFQLDGKEYIWQADPAFWNRHSPVLFPIVGRVIGDVYYAKGKPYHLSQHGFARDSEFALVEQSDTTVKFMLESDEQTLEIYPYPFRLYISYSLFEQSLKVTFQIENPAQEPLLFSIGGHPGFNCPLNPSEESFEDYLIDFHDGSSEVQLYQLEGIYLGQGKNVLPLQNGQLNLSYDLFKNDALIIDSTTPYKISVKSKKSGAGFSMEYADFRWLGIWTKEENAGFICLEPWNGIVDPANHNQDFSSKLGINSLNPGEDYKATYWMEFY